MTGATENRTKESGVSEPVPVGIVTVSDRASRGVYEDRGGPAIEGYLGATLATPWRAERRLIPDERPLIAVTLIALADKVRCPLILVTGGTGPAARDVTPEATEDVCDRLLPGFAEAMRLASLREVPTAILSRQIAGTRGSSLIIDLPGKPSAIRTCLDAIFAGPNTGWFGTRVFRPDWKQSLARARGHRPIGLTRRALISAYDREPHLDSCGGVHEPSARSRPRQGGRSRSRLGSRN